MAHGRSRRWPLLSAGVLVSILVHALLLAAFLLAIRPGTVPRDLPSTIVTFWPFQRAAATVKRPRKRILSPIAHPTPAPAAPIPPAPTVATPSPAGPPPLDIGAALRASIGCANPTLYRLTPQERDACNRRGDVVERASRPLPLLIDPRKTQRWDAELQRRHAPPGPAFTPCQGPGSNFGLGCQNHDGVTVGRF